VGVADLKAPALGAFIFQKDQTGGNVGRTLSRYIIPPYNFPYKPDSLKKNIFLVLPLSLLNLAVAITSSKYDIKFNN